MPATTTTTVALADIPMPVAYADTVRWLPRGGPGAAPVAERAAMRVSMQAPTPAFNRTRLEAGAEPAPDDAGLESWSLAAAAIGMMVFMARRRLYD